MIAALHEAYAQKSDIDTETHRRRPGGLAAAVGDDGGEGGGPAPVGQGPLRARRIDRMRHVMDEA